MTDATIYLAVACFALMLLSADRLLSIALTCVIAALGILFIAALGVVEAGKAVMRKLYRAIQVHFGDREPSALRRKS